MADLITQAKPVFEVGTILSQIVEFSGPKTVDKIAIDLSVTNSDIQTMVVGVDGTLTFQAANFIRGRNTWIFQPTIHWSSGNSWPSSGTTIQNTRQGGTFETSTSAELDAPFLQYDIFLDTPGVYDLWGLGYTSSEGAFWSFDGDTTDMRRIILGQPSGPLEWTKFGSVFSKGGKHTFSIYLSDASTVVLDQWHFTQDTSFDELIASTGAEFLPVSALSKSPFNTAMRVRTLNFGGLDSLVSPVSGAEDQTSWLSSETISASGKHSYQLDSDGTGIIFDDGLSIELWQIGGSSDHFASWNFNFPSSSVGTAFISTDFGENFTEIQ